MNTKKGTKWALSCVATSAAVLSFLVVSNNVLADNTNATQNADGSNQVAQTQAVSGQAAASETATQNNPSTQPDYSAVYAKINRQNSGQDAQQTEGNVQNGNQGRMAFRSVQGQPLSQATASEPVTTSTVPAKSQTVQQPTTKSINNYDVKDGGTFAKDVASYSSSKNTGYDLHPENNELGYAAYFHIFANEAHLKAHTNGNVAVGKLDGGVNFGTNLQEELVDYDVSYIQAIQNMANSSFVSGGTTRTNKVVFGQNVDVDVSDTNRPMADGIQIDHLTADETYQDHDGNVYIDFAKIFSELDNKSNSLTELPPSYLVGSDEYAAEINNNTFSDMNNRVIDLSDYKPNADNQIVIYLSPEVLQGYTPLTIKGISKDGDGSNVIINVDTHGIDPYEINSQINIKYSDGSDRNSQETTYFGDNHLLWNFYDSNASDKLYKGIINTNRVFQGSLLAPEATVNANANLDGNIIANEVNVNAETHRWDLQDNNDKETDYEYETAVPIPGEVPGLPVIDYPDPGDTDGWELPTPPDPDENNGNEGGGDNEGENPDTENPDTEKPGEPDKPVTIPGEVPGLPEVPGIDTDGDGKPDYPGIDTDGDGDPDYPGIDVDGDGKPDYPEIDTDGDGIPDTPEIDTDGDGIPDTPITLPGTESPFKGTETTTSSSNSTNATASNSNKGAFPQTGAKSSAWLSAVGLALLAFLGIKKRKED